MGRRETIPDRATNGSNGQEMLTVINGDLQRSLSKSTGEFDPGSERTLAARLTHASRTRKGFGPGTVAHG